MRDRTSTRTYHDDPAVCRTSSITGNNPPFGWYCHLRKKDALKAIETVYGWDENKLEDQWHKEVLK